MLCSREGGGGGMQNPPSYMVRKILAAIEKYTHPQPSYANVFMQLLVVYIYIIFLSNT